MSGEGRGEHGGLLYSLSGDWAEIAPGVRVRLNNAPNEEDMQFYEPHGVVILEVVVSSVWIARFTDHEGGGLALLPATRQLYPHPGVVGKQYTAGVGEGCGRQHNESAS